MFKKLIATMMIVSIFTVNANAATNSGLKAAFDELNFSLTVDWDQKDKDFYTEQMKKFSNTLRDLQAKGLTNAQLVEFVKSEIKDAKVARDVETAFNMVQINKMSATEANKYMVETMKKSYTTGASWSGDGGVVVIVALLVVVAVIALASAASHGGSSTGGTYNGGYCSDQYVCDTTCYDDYWYGYSCYDDCYYTTYCY